jgi:hypothetical protein
MTLTKSLATMALMSATLTLAGCATAPPPEGGVRIDQQNDVRPALNSVRVIDGSLARYVGAKHRVDSALDVEGVQIMPTPTGFPKINVQLRNMTKVAIPLEVRVSWYDQFGAPTDPASSWTRLFAQPQSMVNFEQVSIRQTSAQYYVEVRGAQ